MKKLISLSLILLLLIPTLVGCLGPDYTTEKTQINALLNELESAMAAKNVNNALNYFANTITVIDSAGTKTVCDKIAYGVIIQAIFITPYSTFDYTVRTINVTNSTNATVSCSQTCFLIGIPLPLQKDKKFTLVKSGGAWEITVDRTNP